LKISRNALSANHDNNHGNCGKCFGGRRRYFLPPVFLTPKSPQLKRAGSGIGRSSAVLLAKEGASGIMIGDLNFDAAAETVTECQAVATRPHFQAKAVLIDVTNEDSVRNLFREAVSEFGRVDFCVNCAGVSCPESEAEML
jgi:hypothetical protein